MNRATFSLGPFSLLPKQLASKHSSQHPVTDSVFHSGGSRNSLSFRAVPSNPFGWFLWPGAVSSHTRLGQTLRKSPRLLSLKFPHLQHFALQTQATCLPHLPAQSPQLGKTAQFCLGSPCLTPGLWCLPRRSAFNVGNFRAFPSLWAHAPSLLGG